MKTKNIAIALIVLIVGVSAGAIGYKKWWLARPTASNFDTAIKRVLAKRNALSKGDMYGEQKDSPCASLQKYSSPDTKHQMPNAFAWYIDILQQDAREANEKQWEIDKLEALTKVGLLSKTNDIVTVKGEARPVSRYRLADKGWPFVGYGNNSKCFYYGKRTYWGVINFNSLGTTNLSGIEVYRVATMFGIAGEKNLAEWARDPAVQAAFGEILDDLKGRKAFFALAKGSGEWDEYNPITPNRFADLEDQVITPEAKKNIAEQASSPPPTIDEIKKNLRSINWLGQTNDFSYTNCLNLPDKVDKDLSSNSEYSVAIFNNKIRTTYDKVAQYTIPYLNDLERAGILKKRSTLIPSDDKTKPDEFETAQIYELADAYAGKIDAQHRCFPLGRPTLEFSEIKISEANEYGFPFSSFQYKVRIKFNNAPAWMNDPALKSAWKELGNTLDFGKACEGKFDFDRKTRALTSNHGTCWWAFNSIEYAS